MPLQASYDNFFKLYRQYSTIQDNKKEGRKEVIKPIFDAFFLVDYELVDDENKQKFSQLERFIQKLTDKELELGNIEILIECLEEVPERDLVRKSLAALYSKRNFTGDNTKATFQDIEILVPAIPTRTTTANDYYDIDDDAKSNTSSDTTFSRSSSLTTIQEKTDSDLRLAEQAAIEEQYKKHYLAMIGYYQSEIDQFEKSTTSTSADTETEQRKKSLIKSFVQAFFRLAINSLDVEIDKTTTVPDLEEKTKNDLGEFLKNTKITTKEGKELSLEQVLFGVVIFATKNKLGVALSGLITDTMIESTDLAMEMDKIGSTRGERLNSVEGRVLAICGAILDQMGLVFDEVEKRISQKPTVEEPVTQETKVSVIEPKVVSESVSKSIEQIQNLLSTSPINLSSVESTRMGDIGSKYLNNLLSKIHQYPQLDNNKSLQDDVKEFTDQISKDSNILNQGGSSAPDTKSRLIYSFITSLENFDRKINQKAAEIVSPKTSTKASGSESVGVTGQHKQK